MGQMIEAYQNHELSEPAPGQNEARSTSLTETSKPLIKKNDSNFSQLGPKYLKYFKAYSGSSISGNIYITI